MVYRKGREVKLTPDVVAAAFALGAALGAWGGILCYKLVFAKATPAKSKDEEVINVDTLPVDSQVHILSDQLQAAQLEIQHLRNRTFSPDWIQALVDSATYVPAGRVYIVDESVMTGIGLRRSDFTCEKGKP